MNRAIVAQFQKSAGHRLTLFSVTVVEDNGDHSYRKIYDVNHSRKYGYLFDQTGAGGSGPVPVEGPYFVSGSIAVKESQSQLVDRGDRPPWRGKKTLAIRKRNRTRRLRVLPKAFELEPGWDLLDWLEHRAIEQDAVYCSVCRDDLPADELCEHCWWCDKQAWYSTSRDRCECKTRDESFNCSPCKAA